MEAVEPCTWVKGWQHVASKVVEDAASALLLERLSHPMCARFRSQEGLVAVFWLQFFPTEPALRMEPAFFPAGAPAPRLAAIAHDVRA